MTGEPPPQTLTLPNADAAGPDKSIGAGCFGLRLYRVAFCNPRPLPAGVLSRLVQQSRGETAAPVGLREEAHYRPDRLIVHRFQNARIRESTVGLAWREERTTRPAGRPRMPAGRAAGLNSTSRFMAFLLPVPSLLSKIGSRQPGPHAPAAATCSALAAHDFKILPAGGQRIALDSARHARGIGN